FETDMADEELFVPYTVKGAIGDIREKVRVLSESYNENGVTLKVRATPETLAFVRKRLLQKT
ncbi:MAG: GTPase HflX, partial [Bdellovibrionia bacterium]